MTKCPSCGAETDDAPKFCRQCGSVIPAAQEEASTWRLPPKTATDPGFSQPTSRVNPSPTADPGRPTGATYAPPPVYYPAPAELARTSPPRPRNRESIRIGDWLVDGWNIYKENWAPMSLGALLGGLLSVCTAGILAGPLLLGLFRMAFKTMRGERPFLGDLFNWEGRFLQALLAFLLFAFLHVGTVGVLRNEFFAMLSLVVDPFLTIGLALTMGLLQDARKDVATAINEVARRIFSRDALMWWIVGLVFMILTWIGIPFCFVGVFVTFPWIVSAGACAYRDTFGFDDPNRTLQ